MCVDVLVAQNQLEADSTAPIPRHWNLQPNWRSSWFGFSFGAAGDLNKDGYLDLVISAPRLAENGSRMGGFAVFAGGPYGFSNSPVSLIRGRWKNARFGESMCGILDFNQDGYGDVLVASPPLALSDAMEVSVNLYAGSASGLQTNTASKLLFRVPDYPRELPLAKAGDLNGDGFQDLLLGANFPSHLSNAVPLIWPVYGSSTGLLWQAAHTITDGGDSFASAGDVNGDGFDDVIIGNSMLSNKNDPASIGMASLYLGSRSGLAATSHWSITSAETHDRIGHGVAGIGDVNHDGFDDVAIGATGRSPKVDGLGRIFVYLGSRLGLSKTPAWMMTAEHPGSYFGRSIVGVGDVNGDKFDDVLVSAVYADAGYDREGRVYLYLGTTNGLEATPRMIVDGGHANAQFGVALASAGDMDQDGLNDFIIGSPYYGNLSSQVGRVDLFYGSREAFQKPIHLVANDRTFVHFRKGKLPVGTAPVSSLDPQDISPPRSSVGFPWLTLSGSILALGAICLLLLRKQRAVVLFRERERIARDLHDEVGAHLTSLTMIGKGTQASEAEKLQEVSLATREIARAFEQAVWAVRPENDTLENFISFLGAHAPKFFNGGPTRCLVDLPVTVPERKLSENVRKNLLPTVKEALNNAAKHSRASEVWLRIKVEDAMLRIVVEDDGCGLASVGTDTASSAEFASTLQGITNMKRRISEIGGDFSIENRTDGGTRVVIQIRI